MVSAGPGAKLYKNRRETLDSTQEPSRSEPPDHAGVAFHPPVLLAIVLTVGFLARSYVPMNFLSPALSTSIGRIFTAASLGWFFWAVYTMRKGDASIQLSEPTNTIVIRGPFRFSRNPIYVSMLFLQASISLWANSLWFLMRTARQRAPRTLERMPAFILNPSRAPWAFAACRERPRVSDSPARSRYPAT